MISHITINEIGCMSSGRCVATHPEIFDFDENRRAVVRDAHAEISQEAADEVIDGCPAGVIDITFSS